MRNLIFTAVALFAAPALADPPSGWHASGESPGDYDMIADASVHHAGHASGLLRSRGTPSGFGTMMQSYKPEGDGGKRWRLTAWMRSENVERWAGMWMRVDGSGKQPLAFDNMQTRPIKGTTPWKRYAVVLDIPKEATNVAFGVLLDGKGAVWIDEIDLEPVGTHIAVTDMMKEESGPKTPRNLGFDEGEVGPAPDGWITAGSDPGDYEMRSDRDSHSGRGAGLLRGKDKAHGFGTLMQIVSAEPYRGKRVRMRVWGKSRDIAGWAGFWMRVDSATGDVTAFDNMQGRPLKGTTAWTRYEVVLDVAEDSKQIAFGELLSGEGATWGDDYSFEVVGKDVPVTDINKSRAEHVFPVNLDFEQ
jgi:hypothetical protein